MYSEQAQKGGGQRSSMVDRVLGPELSLFQQTIMLLINDGVSSMMCNELSKGKIMGRSAHAITLFRYLPTLKVSLVLVAEELAAKAQLKVRVILGSCLQQIGSPARVYEPPVRIALSTWRKN
jgi:hypothetical protein